MKKLIGRGAFTRAYQIAEDKVQVITTCPAKETYAMFSQHNKFAPKIEKDWEYNSRDDEQAFIMPLYPKIRSPKKQLNARSYEVYKHLRTVNEGWEFNGKGYNTFTKWVSKSEFLTEEEKELIIDLASDVCKSIDCDDMCFEISPRNISCDEKGNLVMLDCFFCAKALQSTKQR